MTIDCNTTREQIVAWQRGRLSDASAAEVRAHLDGCAACSADAAAEQTLTEALEQRLPQHPASLALKRQLTAAWPEPPVARRAWWRGRPGAFAAAGAVAAVLLVSFTLWRSMAPATADTGRMVTEAVNDHLRILAAARPIEIESGGLHQVKPWFAGRVEFAPVVGSVPEADTRLQGGAVGYFLDRKAAVFVYKTRLHTTSLLVFRADGLPWPARDTAAMGPVQAYTTTARGYNVLLWRAGGLGYALVSDVNADELRDLGARLATPG